MIKDIATFRRLIPTAISQSIDKYKQPISDAETWVASTLLGREFMRKIRETGEADASNELYDKTRLVVAYKAYIFAIPKMDLVEGNNGFGVVNDTTLLPASKDRVLALIASMESSLSLAVSDLLEYLEDTSEYHDQWSRSPAYTIMIDSILPTLRLFRKYGNFSGDHLAFIAAKPRIKGIILTHIEPKISRELTVELIGQIAANNIVEVNKSLLEDLRYALAAYYNDNAMLGDISVSRAREVLEADPAQFPAFANSSLYRRIADVAKNENNSSTLSIV